MIAIPAPPPGLPAHAAEASLAGCGQKVTLRLKSGQAFVVVNDAKFPRKVSGQWQNATKGYDLPLFAVPLELIQPRGWFHVRFGRSVKGTVKTEFVGSNCRVGPATTLTVIVS